MSSMPTSTAASSMSGMGGMGGGNGCKISMLWNWNTVNSCFISSSWKITSNGMFAGSCIGVILLVMSLEFLRRVGRAYDQYIFSTTKTFSFRQPTQAFAKTAASPSSASLSDANKDGTTATATGAGCAAPCVATSMIRPTLVQQLIRAFIHMLQFAVAYFVMLLAMYYNGYLIICIFIGAFLGFSIFAWEPQVSRDIQDQHRESTMCCG
ncbi:Ctr copper transporter family-domain-containing protein [Elsinoe ampelina]|uniref:Copper transport protein n=1 Tax=Elsinoe ampelina TaxID=302913 RepID=A0A6A6G684_9PEZI|nr:Ctr copper transporter family-domain-containing protein [Elsinoe ampelina]